MKTCLFLLSLFLALNAAGAEHLSEAPPRDALIARIDSAIGTLNKLYWSPTLGIWLDRPGDDLRAHYEGRINPPWWSAANAVETIIDFEKVTGRTDFDAALETLYDLNKEPSLNRPTIIAELKRRKQWSEADEKKSRRRVQKVTAATGKTDFRNRYLDDSAWWAIAWLKMYDHVHAPKYLATARAIHVHMAAAWRADKAGGVMWCLDADKRGPNAITNSLFVILSARLYQRTHEAAFLEWAKRGLEWLHSNKLYDGSGVLDAPGHHADYWTYNQGAYIGALTAYYQATGDEKYLDEASGVADTVLTRAGLVNADGVLVEKQGVSGWDPGLFKGICARYLAQLRDILTARKVHLETARQIDNCLRASAASLVRLGPGPDGQYKIEWHTGARDSSTCNFNTHTSAIALLVSLLPDPQP